MPAPGVKTYISVHGVTYIDDSSLQYHGRAAQELKQSTLSPILKQVVEHSSMHDDQFNEHSGAQLYIVSYMKIINDNYVP